MRISTKYGLYSGLALSLLFFVAFYGQLPANIAGYLGLGILITFVASIFMSIKRTKEVESGGFLDLKIGMRAGIITALLASLCFAISNWAVPYFITPDILLKSVQKSFTDPKQMPKALPGVSFVIFSILQTTMFLTMMGGIISLFVTLILRRETGMIKN